MPHQEKTHDVNYPANDMFELVCDIERYPEFVPLCRSVNMRSRKEKGNRILAIADMCMAYKMLSETFTTRILMDREALTIDVKYIDGPFHHLDNGWRFEELADHEFCRIHFMIDYELRSKVLTMAAGRVFDMAFDKYVDAFGARADAIYGVA